MCPRSWNCRSLRRTTAQPRVTAGAVGSSPSFTRSGRPRASLASRPSPGTTSAASEVRIASGSAMENGMLPVRTQAREYHRRPMQMRRATALGLLVMTVAATACGLPKLEDAQPRVLAQTSFLYAADGSLITELHAGEDRVVLAYAQMPQSIKDATVAIEDQRFWYHHGVDGRALLRAAYIDLRSGRHRRGRLHDHPAAREEPLRRRRADVRAQDRRGGARVAARGAAHEGADPRAVPEHGVLRPGGLRRAGGRPPVLQRGRRRT